MGMSATKRKVVSNLVWAVGGKIVTLVGNLLVGIFVARYLGPEQYGLMNYVISYVALFQIFATFGLDSIEIREESKTPERKDAIIGTAFRLKLIAATITIAFVALTMFLFEADGFTRLMVMMYSLSMLLNTMNVARNYFTSIIWNEYVVKTEISRTVIGIAFKVALLLIHAPLAWFIFAVLMDAVLLASGYAISYRTKIGSMRLWSWDAPLARYMLKQAFPMLLSGAAVIVYTKINTVMLGNMLDKTAVGIYSIAVSFTDVCVFVPTILSQTITPVLVRNYEQDRAQYKKKAQIFMNLSLWGCIIIAVTVSLISYPLIRYTYGVMYLASVPVLQVLVLRLAGVALAQTSGQMIIVEHIQKWAVIRNLIGCAVCIGLNLILIPRYGVMGAAVSSVITGLFPGFFANMLIPAYRKIFVMQTIGVFTGWKDVFKIKTLLK